MINPNDIWRIELVAGLLVLVPAHLPRSHSLQCVCTMICSATFSVDVIFERKHFTI